jgi:hypothetical protein
MKRIRYELLKAICEDNLFEDEYKAIFQSSLADMEARWTGWKAAYDPRGLIPETVETLLTADFQHLERVYERFLALRIPKKIKGGRSQINNPVFSELEDIFNYTRGYDGKIADFFMKWATKLEIRSCYYCEMAYVNTYTYLEKTRWTTVQKRAFDLDHFLPKGKCPCVALSLYNFVPSCQVCNSRIKHDDLPNVHYSELEKICPTSEKAKFDKNITVRLRLRPTGKYLLSGRYVYLRAKRPYRQYVDFFKLNERYSFHKSEAERLKSLKDRYPKSHIKKIAKLLGYREKTVEEDIFQLNYLREKGRCFEKFTRDLLTK